MDEDFKELFCFFSDVEDKRVLGRCKHQLIDVLVIAISAVLCGAQSFVELEEFGKQRIDFFKKFLNSIEEIPSHDTFARVFSIINPDQLEDAFYKWVQSIIDVKNCGYKRIMLDGKSVKGTKRSFAQGKGILHLVSVYCSELGLVLSQKQAKSTGSGETEASKELLKVLDLKGALVSVDAGLATHAITKCIREQCGQYIVPIKKNQRPSLKEIEGYFNNKQKKTNKCIKKEKSHGRLEQRECLIGIVNEKNFTANFKKQWLDVKTVIEIKRRREQKDKSYVAVSTDNKRRHSYTRNKRKVIIKKETVYYITSKMMSAKQALMHARKHWEIENKLHWQLDVMFLEDAWRVRQKQTARNLSVIRKIGFNLITKTKDKGSYRVKMKRAAWNTDYLEKVIFGQF